MARRIIENRANHFERRGFDNNGGDIGAGVRGDLMGIKVNGERVILADSAAEQATTAYIVELDGRATVELRLSELDQADPAGRYRIRVANDQILIQRATGANWASAVTLLAIDANGQLIFSTPEYTGAGSLQALAADLNIGAAVGSEDGVDPSFIGAIMGNLLGADLTKDANYLGGLIGHYNVTGVKATTYPAGAVLAGVGDGVTEVDGAVVAYIDGDSAQTNAEAAFKVMNQNSISGSGFDYGLDLQDAAHDGYMAVDEAFYSKGLLRLPTDVVWLTKAGAPTDGVAGDGAANAGPGSVLIDYTNKIIYTNTNTKASPTWTRVGPLDTQAFIADPSGGGTQDTEARTAIVAILDALIALGAMAAS